jgi:hypothetical protein
MPTYRMERNGILNININIRISTNIININITTITIITTILVMAVIMAITHPSLRAQRVQLCPLSTAPMTVRDLL